MKRFLLILIPTFLALASCGGTSSASLNSEPSQKSTTAPAETVKGWVTQNRIYLDQLGSDSSKISKDVPLAVSSGDYTTVISDCTNFEVDAQAAQSAPPVPSASLEQHWSSGLTYTISAAKDCIAGLEQKDASLVNRFNSELASANAQMQLVANGATTTS